MMPRDPRALIRVLWCEVSAIAVVLTGDIPLWLSALLLVLIPLFGLANPAAEWLVPVRRASSLTAGLYLVFFPIDWFYLSERLIFATVHLMFYLKLHTLLHQESDRERSRLDLICLIEMLAAASMTVDAIFIVPLTLFVLVGTLVLVLEQTRPAKPNRRMLAIAMRTSLTVALPLLVLSGFIFVALPRTSHGGFRLGGTGITVTGFSEKVRLGDFEEIKRSADVVMRIVAKDAPSPPRWRGPAYDLYQEGSWTQTLSGVSILPQVSAGVFLLDRTRDGARVQSEVFLEPLDTDVLFLPPASSSIATTDRYIFIDPYLTLRTGRTRRAGRRYAVSWNAAALDGSSPVGGVERLSRTRRALHTQVPELSGRFHGLGAAIATGENVLGKAASVERYLRSSYDYTLRQPDRIHADPLEDFLFEARAGHCEYFATGMVMLLRSQDVPSRLVTGFNRGERNEVGEFEIIRRLDAHAWVEVYDERRGWVSFDPTPPSLDADDMRQDGFLSQGIDSLRMLWDMYVITFDVERQRSVLGKSGAAADLALLAAGRSLSVAAGHRWAIAGGLLVAIGLFLVARSRFGLMFRWRLPTWRLRRFGPRTESRVPFYETFLKRLERFGVRKPLGQTAADFASEWEDHLPGIRELTEIYYGVRFGGGGLSPEELSRAERLSKAICLAAIGGG